MQQATINNTLTLSFDEGFHIMDQEELGRLFLNDYPNRFGIEDAGRHVTITVVWNRPNALVRAISTVRFALRGTEAILKRTTLKFKRLDYMKTKICENKAEGFSYLYNTADGKEQAGMVIVMKYQGTFYTIYYYARRSDGYSTHKVFSKILGSIEMV